MRIKPWRNDVKRWLELPAVMREDKVLVTSRHHRVEALRASDGAVQWSADLPGEIVEAPVSASEDTLLVQSRDGEEGSFVALNESSGEVRWTKSFSPRWKYSDVASPEGTLVLRRDPLAGEDREPMLMGLSPSSGETLWELSPTGKSWGVPVRDGSGRLFLQVRGGGQSQVMAVSEQDGSVLWTAEGQARGQAIAMGESLLLPQRDGISALNSQTGESLWNHQTRVTRAPLVTAESVVIGTLREDDLPGTRLQGLDPKTGEVLWNYDTAHLTGVAEGPEHQLLHHAYKFDAEGNPRYYLHALDRRNGEPQWSLDLGSQKVLGVGSDEDGRISVAVSRGRQREVLMVEGGQIVWSRPFEGEGVAVASNGWNTALLDRQGVTVVDSDTGEYRGQASVNSPLVNFDGKVSSNGRLALSGIDGELVSLRLKGAETVLEATSKTPGSMRHYGYDLALSEGQLYVDTKADGHYVPGEDALLVSRSTPQEHGVNSFAGAEVVHRGDLEAWDRDENGYLSRQEMSEANLALWWDRDLDGSPSRTDSFVEMAAEGRRQAVVDLDRNRIEVRTRRR